MRKTLQFITTSLLSLILLCSCSAPPASATHSTALDPSKPVSITLWHYYVADNQLALEVAITEFNNTIGLEKGIVVVAEGSGGMLSLEENLYNAANGVINSAPMPDFFSAYPDTALNIEAIDLLVNLNDYFTEDEKAAFVPNFLADGIFADNRLLLVPIVKSTEIFYLNETAWNNFVLATSHPVKDLETWEGVYRAAKAYYKYTDALTPDEAGDGKAFTGIDSLSNYIVIGNKQLGTNIIHADDTDPGSVTLNTPALQRMFNIYYQGFSLGYFDAVGRFRSDDIKSGDIISFAGSSSGASYFPSEIAQGSTMVPVEFMGLSYPTFEDGEPFAIQQGAGICISKSTPQKQEAAAEFIKWFTMKEQNITFAMTTGYLPAQVDAYNSSTFENAVAKLKEGSPNQHIVADVYNVSLAQIKSEFTYSIRPFPGSYNARSILQSSLQSIANEGRVIARPLQEQGLDEEMVLLHLKSDAAFASWLAAIEDELIHLDIPYLIVS